MAAPAWFGATSAPFGFAIFSGFGIGVPFASTPSVQFCFAKGVLSNALPFVRSRRKYQPFRLGLCLHAMREEGSVGRGFEVTYGETLEALEKAFWSAVLKAPGG